ncbi:MAG: sigma-70 family RNA polymerase sigma factor [Acidimicrobiia bacterium]
MTIEPHTDEQPAVSPAVPLTEDFTAFYERELRPVVGLAYVISGSRSGAEDIAQDAFIRAYKHWDTVSQYDNPGAWVRRVVSNRATSVFRRRTAEARAVLRLAGSARSVPELTPDATATWAAVRRLPKRQAQVIALHYYDGSAVPEIARILDCSENTVRTHLRRGRETLSTRLDERKHP